MTDTTPATKAEKTPVTMSDGTIVEFGKKSRMLKTSTIDEATGTVSTRFDFVNGEVRNFTIPASMLLRFAAHGAEQKIGDTIAGETDLADAILSVEDLCARLSAGEWNVRRSAGEFAGTSVLMKALIEASGKTPEDVRTFLSSKTQAEKLALRRSDKLRPIIERLEADKAKTAKNPVDTDSLLSELGFDEPKAKKG